METYKNHTFVEITAFGIENAPYTSYTNEHKDFLGDINFYEIAASTAHAKPRKGIPVEHLSKIWRIDLELAQNTLIVKTQRGVRTDKLKLTRNFDTGDRMLRYKHIRNFLCGYFLCDKEIWEISARSHICYQ